MKTIRIYSLMIIILSVISSCGISERERKLEISAEITHNICDNIAKLTDSSASLLEDPASQLLASAFLNMFDAPINKSCNCVENAVKEKLADKYTIKELLDIEKDGVKQMITLTSIIKLAEVQDSILDCVERSTITDYEDFQKNTDKKLAE